MNSFRGPYVVLSREEIEIIRDIAYDLMQENPGGSGWPHLQSIYNKCDAAIKSSPRFLEPHP